MGASGSVIAGRTGCPKKAKGEKKHHKEYSIGSFIAEGVSGKVYFGKNLANNADVALKFFGYRKNYDAKLADIRHEIDAMLAVRGIEGLVQIQGYFLDTKKGLLPDKIDRKQSFPVIIMELLAGGPLFGRINYRDSISEKFIALMFKKMIFALQSLHQKNFIHRDLKLDNVMFLEKSHDSPVKIIDLGNIVELDSSDAVFRDKYLVGTAGFLAPETILNKEYSKKSDIWQAGCTLYSLLSGLPPFDPNNNKQVTDFSYYPMTGPAWEGISSQAKNLVTKMLKKNADHRISVAGILDHPWLLDEAPDTEFSRDYFTRIKHLALRNKMKAFFLESSGLIEGHTKRKKSLQEAVPIFKQASEVALLTPTVDEELNPDEEDVRNDIELFNSKIKVLKNMVVSSISDMRGGGRKEIDYSTFTGMLRECHLQELCSLQIFNIFDIGNTGTIDPREFLLTMLAFRADNPIMGVNEISNGLIALKESRDGDSSGEKSEISTSHMNVGMCSPKAEVTCDNEDEIRLFFNIFDIKETGYIELEELKIAVNFLLFMGSDQPQSLPNIHELFSIIDVSKSGRIDYQEFKEFYRHLIVSHISMRNNSNNNNYN